MSSGEQLELRHVTRGERPAVRVQLEHLLSGPPVAGRQRPRATSVSWPSGATSSSRAATWEVSPGQGEVGDHRRRAEHRVAAAGSRVEPVVGGARLVGAVGGRAGAAAGPG